MKFFHAVDRDESKTITRAEWLAGLRTLGLAKPPEPLGSDRASPAAPAESQAGSDASPIPSTSAARKDSSTLGGGGGDGGSALADRDGAGLAMPNVTSLSSAALPSAALSSAASVSFPASNGNDTNRDGGRSGSTRFHGDSSSSSSYSSYNSSSSNRTRSGSDVSEVFEVFDTIDRNGDGVITLIELIAALRNRDGVIASRLRLPGEVHQEDGTRGG
jgi:hypothetical protein